MITTPLCWSLFVLILSSRQRAWSTLQASGAHAPSHSLPPPSPGPKWSSGMESLASISIFSPSPSCHNADFLSVPKGFSCLDQIYSNKWKMLAFKTIISGLRYKSLFWKWNLHIKYCSLKIFPKTDPYICSCLVYDRTTIKWEGDLSHKSCWNS